MRRTTPKNKQRDTKPEQAKTNLETPLKERMDAFASRHGVGAAWVLRRALIQFLDSADGNGADGGRAA